MLLRISAGRRQAGHRAGDHRRRARVCATPARRCATAIPPAARWASGSARSAGWPTSATCTRCLATARRWWPGSGRRRARLPVRYAGLVRPITGETECGDVFGAAETAGARDRRAVRRPRPRPARRDAPRRRRSPRSLEDPAAEPAVLVERAHRRIAHTRGGAIGVVQVTGPVVRFAGLGNIAAVILADGTPQGACSRCRGSRATRRARSGSSSTPRRPARRSSCIPTASAAAGSPAALPGLNARDPLVIAAALLAEAGTRRDDAGVLVLKP